MLALDPGAPGMSFNEMNVLLQQCTGAGKWFVLLKPWLHRQLAVSDVFQLRHGVYVIHSYYFHPEDANVHFSEAPEAIDHYIVYNAGTRALFLYPEVIPLRVCLRNGHTPRLHHLMCTGACLRGR